MSIKHISDFQKPISFFLLFSILFVLSCSIENSLTSDQEDLLLKPTDDNGINSPITDYPDDDDLVEIPEGYWENITLEGIIYQYFVIRFTTGVSENDKERFPLLGCLLNALVGATDLSKSIDLHSGYDFRDKYLLKSEKGELYTACYYLLSHYAIENNLLMKHPLEHISIMETGIEVSKELQHGTNNNKILIDKSTYENLNELSKIYRNSENNLDIDIAPILDYLEADLEKYYNKPKAEIAADFGF